MKKLIALLSSLALCGGAFTAINANAQEESKTYTYLELLEMSDEKIVEIYGDEFVKYGFGNDLLSDEDKFYDMLATESYESWYRCYVSGQETPYFDLHVNENVALDDTVTAEMLGYPIDWTVKCNTGKVWGDEVTGYWQYKANSYRVYPTSDIFNDFEAYVRLIYSGRAYAVNEDDWSIENFSDPFDVVIPKK